jgi:predicted nucleic acid-binding protein
MIDLDVLYVEFSKKRDERKEATKEFLKKLDKFKVYTPYILIDTVDKWKDKKLVVKIKNFYELNSEHIISAKEIEERLAELKIDEKELKKSFGHIQIKDEDTLLIIVASIFGIESIITFNKRHLLNNKEKINEILRRFGLNEIAIEEPS